MIIAIPIDENKVSSNVCPSFGRAPYFLIQDTDTNESNIIENIGSSSPGGAGIKAAQVIIDNKVEALIVPRLGDNAADVLKAAEIKIYRSGEGSAEDNIKALIDGGLSLLEETHAGFHKHGN